MTEFKFTNNQNNVKVQKSFEDIKKGLEKIINLEENEVLDSIKMTDKGLEFSISTK